MPKTVSIEDVMKTFGKITFERERLHTGSLTLNALITGNPALGVPMGESIELWGTKQSGKTTMAFMMVGEALAAGERVVWVDAEGRIALDWAKRFDATFTSPSMHDDFKDRYYGGRDAWLIRSTKEQKLTLEAFFDKLLYPLLEDKYHPNVMVLDSVPDLSSFLVHDADADKKFFGIDAAIWSQQFPVIKQYLVATDCILVLLNQARVNMGVPGYHPPKGEAMKHAPSAILYMSSSSTNNQAAAIGTDYKITAKVDKSSLGGPRFQKGDFNLRLCNIPNDGQVFDVAYDVVQAGRMGFFVRDNGDPIFGGNATMHFKRGDELVKLGSKSNDVYELLQRDQPLLREIYLSMMGIENEE